MKKLIALVLAALMMFTLVAPASAATSDLDDVADKITSQVSSIIPTVTEKVSVFERFIASIKDFMHKIVGTITQTFGSECPFCDGTHLAGTPSVNIAVLDKPQTVTVDGKDYVLDVAYNFTPAENAAKAEEFRYWHADFVVTTTKDVKNVLLAGQYDSWSENYVGFFVDEIKAGDEVRLIETYDNEFIDKDIYVNCEELLTTIKSFNCGMYSDNVDNIGATITVELRLYETYPAEETGVLNSTNVETGRWVTVATVPCTIIAA